MTPTLIVHIVAGCIGILSGFAAVSVRKGERLHRTFGTAFFLSMLITSALAIYLAAFVPPVAAASAAPPGASIAIAALTFYLALTAWMTVRRRDGSVGLPEKLGCVAAAGLAAILVALGLRAAWYPTGGFNPPQPYFVFAALAALSAVLDLKVILRRGISGVPRIARHVWRMSTAFFFAAAFFFIGQQKVMPAALHRSPVLFVLAFAPLLIMIFWLVRIRFGDRFKTEPRST